MPLDNLTLSELLSPSQAISPTAENMAIGNANLPKLTGHCSYWLSFTLPLAALSEVYHVVFSVPPELTKPVNSG